MERLVATPMVHADYVNFFLAVATAGGTLIGLLFVAISLSPERIVRVSAPIESRIVASSTFSALFNAFFISLGATLPHWNIAWLAGVMSLAGVFNSLNQGRVLLMPWPSWQNVVRRLWLTALSLCLYVGELVYSILLLFSPTNQSFVFTLGLFLISIYGLALLRAWELLGVQRYGLLAWLNPLYDLTKEETHPATSQKEDSPTSP